MKHKYKTLKGLMRVNSNYFTLDNYRAMRIYHTTKGWIDIKLTDELKKEIVGLFLNVLGNNDKLKDVLLINEFRNLGIYNRLWIDKKLRGVYCAGQDYPSEIRYIKRELLKDYY